MSVDAWIAKARVPAPLRTTQFVLQPLGPEHNERDHRAWSTSIDHIRATPGFAPGDWESDDWPVCMTPEQNLDDLMMHRREFDAGEAFAYCVLANGGVGVDDDVVGCVYIDPDPTGAAEAVVRCWVTADRASLDTALAIGVHRWIVQAWPLVSVRFPGRVELLR